MARKTTPLSTYLFSHPQLRNRLEDIRTQSLLVENLMQRLPPALRGHCVGARQDGETLVVFAESGAWATRLRYEVARILPEMAARNFQVRVVPPESPQPEHRGGKPPRLAPSAAAVLEETADALEDPDLADVLRRLAAHRRGA